MQNNIVLPKIITVGIWFIFSQTALFFMNDSLIIFFLYLNPPTGNPPNYVISFAFLVSSALYGWLFFEIFFKPGSINIIPSNVKKIIELELLDILKKSIFISLWSVIFKNIGLRIGRPDITLKLSMEMLFLLCLIALLWSFTWMRNSYIEKRAKLRLLEELPNPSIPLTLSKALKKINSLSKEERDELATLIYKQEVSRHFSIVNLWKFILLSLFFSFVIELAQELLKRF